MDSSAFPSINSKSQLKNVLANMGIYLTKQRSQHFLYEPQLIKKIIDTLYQEYPGAAILEIGSGLGALTLPILQQQLPIVAIEIDQKCMEFLKPFFDNDSQKIIHGDALKVDWRDYHRPHHTNILLSNTPFQITTSLLMKFKEHKHLFDAAFFIVQREYVNRLNAQPGSDDYSALTLMMQVDINVQVLFHLSKQSFFPIPKVDATLIKLVPKRQASPFLNRHEEELYYQLVEKAFRYRRKTFLNALKQEESSIGWCGALGEWLNQHNFSELVRGEVFTMDHFIDMTHFLGQHP